MAGACFEPSPPYQRDRLFRRKEPDFPIWYRGPHRFVEYVWANIVSGL
jgi:hypothetical protein